MFFGDVMASWNLSLFEFLRERKGLIWTIFRGDDLAQTCDFLSRVPPRGRAKNLNRQGEKLSEPPPLL